MGSEAEAIAFDEAGLVTAVAKDAETGQVLMVAHMTRDALERTLATRQGWYWSRSRGRLWRKGEESGHTQRVREVRVDCDGDAVLLLVDQLGAACHTGRRSCFHRTVAPGTEGGFVLTEAPSPEGGAAVGARGVPAHVGGSAGPEILAEVAGVLRERRRSPSPGSYSARLFAEGLARLNEKIMEEAAEVTRAARTETSERLVSEVADLWFHSLALLVFQGVDPGLVFAELATRRR
jgi:phosphoribosyl-AMP cyclohydrolase / phosphoribosyl-ATP pyrophosphohydrolase